MEIRAIGATITAALDADVRWWDDWTGWEPDPRWSPDTPPPDWLDARPLSSRER